jgi:hypothetical protein
MMDGYHRRIREAYLTMARLGYRPAAPSDGFGNICLGSEQLRDHARLENEAMAYVREFTKADDGRDHWVGCTNFETNRAAVYTLEAVRNLNGGMSSLDVALKLLKAAVTEVETIKKKMP